MSSHDDTGVCPNCKAEMNTYSENRPFDKVSGQCLGCGFNYYTVSKYYDLEVLNELRQEYNDSHEIRTGDIYYKQPLAEIPEQDGDLLYE